MNFADRLEGTSLEDDNKAWIVCSMLDWCRSVGVVTPTERDWCRILGCFPKNKARRGEEKKGYFPQNQVHSLFEKLDEEGVVAMIKGKGRGRNTYEIPEGKNLVADKRADYERRREEWKNVVIEKLKDDVEVKKTATWAGVKKFFEYWSECDADYNMRWENALRDSSKKYFSIGGRWSRWKDKIVIEQTTQPTPPPQRKIITAKDARKKNDAIAQLQKEWLAERDLKDFDGMERIEEFKKYLKDKGMI